MNEKLEEKLFKNYKELFKYKGDIKKSLMDSGFRCGDGWYDIVECLCEEIYYYVEAERVKYPHVYSVEDHSGSFRFEVENLDPKIKREIEGAISYAMRLAFSICSSCGNKGKWRVDGFFSTPLCDSCYVRIKLRK